MLPVWKKIEATSEFQNADVVFLYWSLGDEVPTHEFIEKWAGIKRIALPKVVGEDMELYQYDPSTMQKGAFGIMEPGPGAVRICPLEVDIAIVPGRKFDLRGGRKGRGKGYYDRFLPKLNCPAFGIAFPEQIVDELELKPHDFILDKIIY